MKTVNVVAAIIIKDGKVFSTQRGYGEFKGKWEFPGGKIENGETPQESLIREIKEELNVDIIVNEFVDTIEYDYPHFHLSMQCFVCSIYRGNVVLKEHDDAKWLSKDNLFDVEWLEADLKLLNKIKNYLIL